MLKPSLKLTSDWFVVSRHSEVSCSFHTRQPRALAVVVQCFTGRFQCRHSVKLSVNVTLYTLSNVSQSLIQKLPVFIYLKASGKRAFTISPKASPLQLVSSGLNPVDERSEWAGETGGEEPVLPNCIICGAVF